MRTERSARWGESVRPGPKRRKKREPGSAHSRRRNRFTCGDRFLRQARSACRSSLAWRALLGLCATLSRSPRRAHSRVPRAALHRRKPRRRTGGRSTWFGLGFYGDETACGQDDEPGAGRRRLARWAAGRSCGIGHGRELTVPVVDRGPGGRDRRRLGPHSGDRASPGHQGNGDHYRDRRHRAELHARSARGSESRRERPAGHREHWRRCAG